MEPNHDEVLKLGPPATGEVIIKVDPRRSGSAFAMGTESLAPGAAIPVHRHLSQDEVLFIHKGQGRATLEGTSMTVLPGIMLYVPRNAWHGLRNTGTGLLQFTWTSAPPGIEEFFREVSRLGASSDAAAVQAVALRHGMEFHPAGEAATATETVPGHRRRRHRRGGRGGGRGPAQPSPAAVQPVPPSIAPPARPQPAAAPVSGQPQRGPRRRHRRRQGRPPQPATTGASAPSATPARPSPPVKAAGTAAAPRRQRGGSRRYRGRVKEVYMDGRWVQVTGEGPVIAPGREGPRHGRLAKDEDTPSGPLSVPL